MMILRVVEKHPGIRRICACGVDRKSRIAVSNGLNAQDKSRPQHVLSKARPRKHMEKRRMFSSSKYSRISLDGVGHAHTTKAGHAMQSKHSKIPSNGVGHVQPNEASHAMPSKHSKIPSNGVGHAQPPRRGTKRHQKMLGRHVLTF